MEYIVKYKNDYIVTNVEVANYKLVNLKKAARRFRYKDEAVSLVSELVRYGLPKEELSVEEFDRYSVNEELEERGDLVVKRLFEDSGISREDIDRFIKQFPTFEQEKLTKHDVLIKVEDLLKKHYPQRNILGSIPLFWKEVSAYYLDVLGLADMEQSQVAPELINEQYEKLNQNDAEKVLRLDIVMEMLIAAEQKERGKLRRTLKELI